MFSSVCALAACQDGGSPVADQVRVLVNRYYIAYGQMMKFDQALDSARTSNDVNARWSIWNSDYISLLAQRPDLESMEQNLAGAVSEAAEKLRELDLDHPARSAYIQIMQSTRAALSQLDEVEQIAALGLARRMVQSGQADFLPPQLHSLANEPDSLAPHLQKHEAELKQRAQVASAVSGDSAISSADFASVMIAPSTGKLGNLFGDELPPGVWALTYDDGPSTAYTPQILENLARHKMLATFFWLAENVTRGGGAFLNVVEAVGQAGHARENHSYSHPELPKLGPAALEHEVGDAKIAEEKVYGTPIDFFRLPYGAGASNPQVRTVVRQHNMISVLWNADSLDWQDHNPTSVFARVQKQMALAGRGIILFHDIHPQSVIASEMVMKYIDSHNQQNPQKAITMVTLPQVRQLLAGENLTGQ